MSVTSVLKQPVEGARAAMVGLSSLAAAAALLPVVYLVLVASQRSWREAIDAVALPAARDALVTTLGLAVAVAVASTVIGVALAWLVTRSDLPGRAVWRVVTALPLAVPSYLGAAGYASFFPSARSPGGAWLVLTLLTYPFVYLPVMTALRGLEPSLDEVASSLGDGPGRRFLRVTLPQIRPAAAIGALLAALFVVSDFGAVAVLRVRTFAVFIYQSYLVGLDPPRGAARGCLLLIFTFVLVLAEARLRGRARYDRFGPGTARPQATVSLRGWRWPATAVVMGVAAGALGVPSASLGRGLVEAVQLGVDLPRLSRSSWSSLLAATAGAAVTVAAALPVALLAARHRDRLTRLIDRSTYLAQAIPGVVVALSMIFFAARIMPGFYRRLPVLVFAYAVLFLPLALSVLHARARQIPAVYDEVARSLGHRPLGVLRTVTGPLLAPGVAAGLALAFLAGLKEVPATLLVAPFGFETLATQAFSAAERGSDAGMAFPSLLIVALAAAGTAALVARDVRTPVVDS